MGGTTPPWQMPKPPHIAWTLSQLLCNNARQSKPNLALSLISFGRVCLSGHSSCNKLMHATHSTVLLSNTFTKSDVESTRSKIAGLESYQLPLKIKI